MAAIQANTVRQKPVTAAGKHYNEALTQWLQDTRLMSEAVFRLYQDHRRDGTIRFNDSSWPKGKNQLGAPLKNFAIDPVPLSQRMDGLLKNLWRTRFVFLETLWEEYLQELVIELRHEDAAIFEPFCEKEFMADIVRDVLIDRLASVEEIKDEVAARFAAGITREHFDRQWRQLAKLQIGLSEADKSLPWFANLDTYFEMRNCIIHRQSQVSPALNKKTDFYAKNGIETIEVWPQSLDFYRHQFIACLFHIESRVAGKYKAIARRSA